MVAATRFVEASMRDTALSCSQRTQMLPLPTGKGGGRGPTGISACSAPVIASSRTTVAFPDREIQADPSATTTPDGAWSRDWRTVTILVAGSMRATILSSNDTTQTEAASAARLKT